MIKYLFMAAAIVLPGAGNAQGQECALVRDGLTTLAVSGFEPIVTGKGGGAIEVTTWAREDAQWIITVISGDTICFVAAGHDFKDMTRIPNV